MILLAALGALVVLSLPAAIAGATVSLTAAILLRVLTGPKRR